MKPRRLAPMLVMLLLVSIAFTACGFVGARPPAAARVPGFFVGIWDGLIAPWTLLLRVFIDIGMYAVPNSGWWYHAGFLLGVSASLPVGWIAALIAVAQHVL